MRVMGIDPGLTRCGVGVVEGRPGAPGTMIAVGVVRTDPEAGLADRLLALDDGLRALLDEHQPEAVAVERVFSQHNVASVIGTAQASGIALLAAARLGLPTATYTPSEVKNAVCGNGTADKRQVTTMVTRILRLKQAPKPADAADALAIAVCHLWRGGVKSRIAEAAASQAAAVAAAKERTR
ncbi:MAG: crossover junction endodeoxyribonuclease RuvC [Glycomyces artemisiae]|uniref:Crossover junction endodeoxyribonuclease RuvC n=1 Tax=Glycomyces artemisiae TaxID=1076443 RepID=A0A850C920_9ACTN|nr:crossover junction endodeoxyribonuclease RuvC [Glycomyces artemisiae]